MAVAHEVTIEGGGRSLRVVRYTDGEVRFQINSQSKHMGFRLTDPTDVAKIEAVLDDEH